MRHPWRQLPHILGALALVMCTQACTTPPDARAVVAEPASEIPPAERVADRLDPLLPSPLQRFRLSPRQLATVNTARAILIDRCMQQHGYSYPHRSLADETALLIDAESTAISRIYGITDLQSAAQFGYGFAPPARPTPSLIGPARSSDYLAALHGSPPAGNAGRSQPRIGGCAASADRALDNTDPDRSPYGLAHNAWIQVMTAMTRSDKYEAVISDWRACMTSAGHRVTHPIEDQGDIARAIEARRGAGDETLTGPAASTEIELATADVTCKRETHLAQRLNSQAAELAELWIHANKPLLEADWQRITSQLALARAIQGHDRHGES